MYDVNVCRFSLSEIWQTRPFPSASRGQAARPAMVHHGKCCGHGRDKDDEQTLRNSSRAVLPKAANLGLDQVLGSLFGQYSCRSELLEEYSLDYCFSRTNDSFDCTFGDCFNHYSALQNVFFVGEVRLLDYRFELVHKNNAASPTTYICRIQLQLLRHGMAQIKNSSAARHSYRPYFAGRCLDIPRKCSLDS